MTNKSKTTTLGILVISFAALAGCVEDPGYLGPDGDQDEDKSANLLTAADVPSLGDSFAECWVDAANGSPQLMCQRVGAAFASYKLPVTVTCDGVSRSLPADKTTPVGVCGLLAKTTDVEVTLALKMPYLSSSTGFYWSGQGLHDAVKTAFTLKAADAFANADNPSATSPARLQWPFMTWHLIINNSMAPDSVSLFNVKLGAPDIAYAGVTSASGEVVIKGSELWPDVTWVSDPSNPAGGKIKQVATRVEGFIVGSPSGVAAELRKGRTKVADYTFTKAGVYDVSDAGIAFVSDVPAQ